MKIIATTRSLYGTSASRRLRNSGKTPGILYGGTDAPIPIEIDHNPIYHALKKEAFHASIHDLELDGKTTKVLLRDFQTHAFKQLVLHLDLQRVDPNKPVHMKAPLHFINAEISPAVKVSSAIINHVVNELNIICLPKDLPEFISVDLSTLQVGVSLHLKSLSLPAGVTTADNENLTIVTAVVPAGLVEEPTSAAATPTA